MATDETNEEAIPPATPGSQLYHEVHNVLRRWRAESAMTLYEIMGVLGAVQQDVGDAMKGENQ